MSDDLLLRDDFNLRRFADKVKMELALQTGNSKTSVRLKGFALYYLSDNGELMVENIFVKGFNPLDHNTENLREIGRRPRRV